MTMIITRLSAVALLAMMVPPFAEASSGSKTKMRISAYIDGISFLYLTRNEAHWLHKDYAAPGMIADGNNSPRRPTVINYVPWFPDWPEADGENRDCNCLSSTFTRVNPPLPSEREFTVELSKIHCRDSCYIAQQPTRGNGYTLILAFDDEATDGAAWYEVSFKVPAAQPSHIPSNLPAHDPSNLPSQNPSNLPSQNPTRAPSQAADPPTNPAPAPPHGLVPSPLPTAFPVLEGPLSLDVKVIRIAAFIDGRSRIILFRGTVRWHHDDRAAPGRANRRNEPTIVNDVIRVYPEWPDLASEENANCNCDSLAFEEVQVEILNVDVEVEIARISCRGAASVVVQPTRDNDYTIAVEFDDRGLHGAAWYEVLLFVPAAISASPSQDNSGSFGMVEANTSLAASANNWSNSVPFGMEEGTSRPLWSPACTSTRDGGCVRTGSTSLLVTLAGFIVTLALLLLFQTSSKNEKHAYQPVPDVESPGDLIQLSI